MRRSGGIILLIGMAGVALVAFRFVRGGTERGPIAKEISITVPEGASLSDAAVFLKWAGAVRSADAFLTCAKVFGANKSIKAGELMAMREELAERSQAC